MLVGGEKEATNDAGEGIGQARVHGEAGGGEKIAVVVFGRVVITKL